MALTEEHLKILCELGLPGPEQWPFMTDDQLIELEDALCDEFMTRCINETGDGLTERGEMCVDIIVALPD